MRFATAIHQPSEALSRVFAWLKHATRRRPGKRLGSIAVVFGACLAAQPAQSAPTPALAMDAYRTVDAWVRAAALPDDAPPIDLSGATAVSVTLRRGGRVIGRGSVVVDPSAPAQALREATGRAWAEANEHLRGENDALQSERLFNGAMALTIDLELAGQWTPIGGDTFVDAAGEITPGIDGVGARVGDRLVAVFPGTMQSTNREPSQALLSASGSLDLAPLPLGQLRENHDLVVYRFPVMRLTQIHPGSAPVFLFRGGRVTPSGAVTSNSLKRFANTLARNLLSRHWPGDEPLGLMGTLRPWVGDYAEPVIAEPRSQALAALALARWASLHHGSEAPRGAIVALLTELAEIDPNETDPASEITSAAMTLYAINEARRIGVWDKVGFPTDVAALRTRCRIAVELGVNQPDQLAPPSLALIACAAASDETIDRSATEQIVRTLFREAPPQELPALSPWLGWAELALRKDGSRVPAAIALREHRSILWRHQIGGTGAKEPDLIGGIVFTAARHPEPNWQTARALALIATMLGDERLTKPDERLLEIVRLTRAMRFLMELAIDETDAALVPISGSAAVGAVRMSLTDHRCPLDATAMTLLTVCETIRAFEQIESSH